MSRMNALLVFVLLLLGGCKYVDFHPYSAGSLEVLSESEVRTVMDKFKLQMARRGSLGQVRTERYNGHYARFSTSVIPSDAYYLVLAYAPEDGFILTFPITTRSLIDERITDIRLLTEEVIFEATSKKVPLRVYVEWP